MRQITRYDHDLKAQLILDDRGRVRQILHTKYPLAQANSATKAASGYLHRVATAFGIAPSELNHLHQRVNFLDPREQPTEYRLSQEKKYFDSTTVVYYQTIHNTPVWDGGLTVTVKQNPHRVVGADHRGHPDLEVDLPPRPIIELIRDRLTMINSSGSEPADALTARPKEAHDLRFTYRLVFENLGARSAAGREHPPDGPAWFDAASITHGAFYIYRYAAKDRLPHDAAAGSPELSLPPVPERIAEGQHYLVAEIVFHLTDMGKDWLNWRALVDVGTGAILSLRPLIAGVSGLVFAYDPKTQTGDLANTSDDATAALNPLRTRVDLFNLDAPVAGTQSLAGSHVKIIDDDSPAVAPPTEPTLTNFDFDARTNNFAAVNAYHHSDSLFDLVEDLGFTAAAYFGGTAFPVHVDHRASYATANGVEINAFCGGDAQGNGIGLVGFCLADQTNLAEPLGIALDKWLHWHEIGGHGTLWNHVNSPNFGFAHSAGDSLGAFQNDPESALRALPQRFQWAPFVPWSALPAGIDRWFNRDVAAGWGWGGSNDLGGYESEQVLATTLFRMYRSIGGDAADVAKRRLAARVATYLVLNAIGKLAPGANADTPYDFYAKLVEADADDWTTEGLAGGAYKKLIRWSFEKQGLFQPVGAPSPTTTVGAPPSVDLYIDDGRGGEYQYQAVHWQNQSMWNRVAPDGMTGHQPAVAGVTNYAYVKVKNRGTADASGPVKIYHSLPGAGLTWPTDFVQAGPAAGLATGSVLANNGNEVIVGPFAWTPNTNAYGHDCLLAVVETAQDPSNIQNLGPGDTIQEWRLVPHDNNIGQRNVQLVPGGGGIEGLAEALAGAFFIAGNNFNRPVDMTVKVTLPPVLAERGWGVHVAELPSRTFRLEPGEKRRVELRPTIGAAFTADDIRKVADRTVLVELYGDATLLGGMSYEVDPNLVRAPAGAPRKDDEADQERNHRAGRRRRWCVALVCGVVGLAILAGVAIGMLVS